LTYTEGEEKKVKRIFAIAGGSGITPIYQVIREIISMGDDLELIMLFGNKKEEDIVLRKELEALRPRLNLHYILDEPPQEWKGHSGYIT
jgi:cytochrome-b5 reductase